MVSLCIICIGISSGCAALCLCRLIYSFTVAFFTFSSSYMNVPRPLYKIIFNVFESHNNHIYKRSQWMLLWTEKKLWIFLILLYTMNGNRFFMVYEVKQWNINGFVHVCGIIVLVYQSLYINCPNTLSLYSAQL